MTRLLTLVATLMLGTAAVAHDIIAGDLKIIHPAIPAPFAGAKSAAGYMAILNSGTEPDRLIGVSATFAAMAMLHLSQTSAEGVASMSHVPTLEIPPGETVVLESGGYHVMFMGLTRTLTEGDLLPGTLTFEKAGTVEVDFKVDPPGAARHDHSQHGAANGTGQQGPVSPAGMTASEAAAGPDLTARLDGFEGTVLIGPRAAHAHGG